MKVVCDACQAKYQIPDERVAGRKLKIRCRKCGNAILVRGEQASGEVQTISSIPPAAELPREIEWHVSIDGEQHGPYASEQMGSMLRGGQVAWDAYVWREGYADWKPAGDSDTLVRAVAAASTEDDQTATAQVPNPAASAFAADEDPTRLAQSPTGEALQPVARVAFASRVRGASQPPMAASNGGLRAVAQQPAAGYATAGAGNGTAPALRSGASYAPRAVSQPPVAAGYAGPRAVSQPPAYASSSYPQAAPEYSQPHASLTGERNEDSVLFSARNLALAASPGATSAPAASAQSGGYASGDGSGLIDIRALAALAQAQVPAHQVAPAAHAQYPGVERDVRSSDALLRMANQTGVFAHLDSLAPMDRASQAPNRAVPLAILGGSAMIAAAAFVALYIFRPQPAQPVAATALVPSVGIAEPAEPATAPQQAAAEPAAAPTEVAKAEPAAEPADEPADEPAAAPVARGAKSQKTVSAKRAAAPSTHVAKSEPARVSAKEAKEPKEAESAKKSASIDDMLLGDSGKKSEPKPEPKAAATPDDDLLAGPMPAPAKNPAKPKSIDDLLDDAVPAKGASKPAASAASDAALPETPTRDQVLGAMKGVEPDVKACAEGQAVDSASAQVAVTVTGATGRVTSVRVTGVQGAIGSCVARAVRAATFPKFAKSSLSINFPFKLK